MCTCSSSQPASSNSYTRGPHWGYEIFGGVYEIFLGGIRVFRSQSGSSKLLCQWSASEKRVLSILCQQIKFVQYRDEVDKLTWNTASKFIGEFWYKIIINSIFQWPQHNHRPGVLQFVLYYRFIRHDWLFTKTITTFTVTRIGGAAWINITRFIFWFFFT